MSLMDVQVLFLSDIFPTGYMAAEFCNIQRGNRDLGLRTRWTNGYTQRIPPGRRARNRGRYRARASSIRAFRGRHHARFQERGTYDRIQDLTQGRGAELISTPSARSRICRAASTRRRSRESRDLSGHRSAARSAPGDLLLPQFRNRLIVGVYGGFVDKIPMGSAINRGLYVSHGSNAGTTISADFDGAHRERRNRSLVRHHAPRVTRRWSQSLQDVSGQGGRLHQSRSETLNEGYKMATTKSLAIVTGAGRALPARLER